MKIYAGLQLQIVEIPVYRIQRQTLKRNDRFR